MAGEVEARFIALMSELFQLREAEELDFGIYRLIRRHNRRMREFLGLDEKGERLQDGGEIDRIFDQAFRQVETADIDERKRELARLGAAIGIPAHASQSTADEKLAEAETFPAMRAQVADYRRLRDQLHAAHTATDDRTEALNRLHEFYDRHYQDGDFIVQRRYGKDGARYVKSTGDDTEFRWATEDMYYIKSGDIFTDYPVRLPNGKALTFAVDPESLAKTRAELKPTDKAGYQFKAIRLEDGGLRVVLDYIKGAQNKGKLDKIVAEAATKSGAATDEVARQLRRYIARNQSDFFIHKRLREALDEDLDIFIKAEVLDAEQLLAAGDGNLAARAIRLARAVREIGRRINAFLGVLEDHQKRLWEKKKLVLETRSFWRSDLARAIPDMRKVAGKDGLIDTAQAQRWLAARQKEGKFKQAEYEAVGIGDWLAAQKGKVSVSDIQGFTEQGGVQVRDVVLGETGGAENAVRFGEYVLPGGENYRELLLTLPKNDSAWSDSDETEYRRLNGMNNRGELDPRRNPEGRRLFRELQARIKARDADTTNFRASHFDQLNILAHVRFNERVDSEGRRVLFLEEVQSDWGQRGREKGFRPTAQREAELRGIIAKAEADGKDATPEQRNGWVAAMNELQPGTIRTKPAPAPFVTDTKAWAALAMKRMIRYAVDNGFDAISWTTGEQQADRYDLSKEVSNIKVAPRANDITDEVERTVYIHLVGGDIMQIGVGHDGVIDAVNRGAPADLKGKALSDVVGKELSERIMSMRGRGTLSAGDLKVGGEGMRSFYDRIVPQVANDVLKKLGGGRVEIVGISADEEQIAMPQPGFLITDALRDKVRTEGVALFSRADNSAIETATRRMDKFVAEFEAGRLKDGDTQILGDTPVVLLALGADNRSLQIDGATVRKALAGKHRFDLTADSLRQVARALYDPLAVFVPARIDWTLFCNSGCLSHGIGLTGFKG